MCSQAIDQTTFPEVLGKTKVFYCPLLVEFTRYVYIPWERNVRLFFLRICYTNML